MLPFPTTAREEPRAYRSISMGATSRSISCRISWRATLRAAVNCKSATRTGARRSKANLGICAFITGACIPAKRCNLGCSIRCIRCLQIAGDRRSEDQKKWLRAYFLSDVANNTERQENTDLEALNKGLDEINREIPSTMIMGEMEKPRDTFVLARGDYRNHGEQVFPNTPSVLPPLPKDAPANRLTLAKWLVDPGNPLTARVAVNHFWQMYFGIGIVKTAEDFGSQGDPPSNQQLLDWLATEFIGQNGTSRRCSG